MEKGMIECWNDGRINGKVEYWNDGGVEENRYGLQVAKYKLGYARGVIPQA
jgi:hypothetical protein